MLIVEAPSPNFSKRPDNEISCVVLHDTASHNILSTLAWFSKTESKVSAHYIVGKDGNVYKCVDEENKAWHAGVSQFWGRANVNDFSIGIELVDDSDSDKYPDSQMHALLQLCTIICKDYSIPINRVVGHCHIAPERKIDPGKDFPWYEFLNTLGAFLCHDADEDA